MTQEEIPFDLFEISLTKVSDWVSFCREVVIFYNDRECQPIGDPGKVVEIDKAKFSKRKYNRGRIVEGQWVFGGFERETKRCFMAPVHDRTKETLLLQIKEWIKPGTHVISDGWAAYQNLEEEGYTQEVVNHSENFVDPKSGAHTQNRERRMI